jgi:alanine dehydrogenase
MRIGIPKEIKDGESRVGATPDGVRNLVEAGHILRVETGAGARIGFEDAAYLAAGAQMVATPEAIFDSPLIVKVKELQKDEYARLRRGSIVACYQQLARDPELLEAVLTSGITCLAYESVTLPDGRRPMLAPMSALAGQMTAQIAAWALQSRPGPLCGSGILLSGAEGVPPARVLILGDGIVGETAARAFLRLGCPVTVLGLLATQLQRLEGRLKEVAAGPLETAFSSPEELARRLADSDVVIGAIAIPGRLTPKLITRPMLRTMRPGSVLIDVGIDMGGVAETSRQTKLSDPLYLEEGVLHYGVPNIPALVPRAATQGLTAATLPYVRLIADLGLDGALAKAPELIEGLLVQGGQILSPALAEDTGRACAPRAASQPIEFRS